MALMPTIRTISLARPQQDQFHPVVAGGRRDGRCQLAVGMADDTGKACIRHAVLLQKAAQRLRAGRCDGPDRVFALDDREASAVAIHR